MDNIKTILSNKKIPKANNRINIKYERSVEFLEYINIEANQQNAFYILKIGKIFGFEKVMNTRSWLKDIDIDQKRWKGLIYWKLKQ